MDRFTYRDGHGEAWYSGGTPADRLHRLADYEDLELTPEEIEQTMLRFSSFLMEMTGGRMSKTNYTVQAMISEANDYFESVCDECSDRQELAEIKKELEKVKEERMALKVDNLNLSSMVEQLREINAQAFQSNQAMASALKKEYGCGGCKHCNSDFDQEPCDSCRKAGDFPKWEWKGE